MKDKKKKKKIIIIVSIVLIILLVAIALVISIFFIKEKEVSNVVFGGILEGEHPFKNAVIDEIGTELEFSLEHLSTPRLFTLWIENKNIDKNSNISIECENSNTNDTKTIIKFKSIDIPSDFEIKPNERLKGYIRIDPTNEEKDINTTVKCHIKVNEEKEIEEDVLPEGVVLASIKKDTDFKTLEYRSSIQKITIEKGINIPSNAKDSWDYSETHDGRVMIYTIPIPNVANRYELHIQYDGDILYANPNMDSWFSGFIELEEIKGLNLIDTRMVTNMDLLFENCRKLTTIDLSNFNTSNVTSMSGMFNKCLGLTKIDVSKFDTSKVTDFGSMFFDCRSLNNIDTKNFDTSQAKKMDSMFRNCINVSSFDLRNFDTTAVENIRYIFAGCHSLTKVTWPNLVTPNVTDASHMFQDCYNLLTADIRNADFFRIDKTSSNRPTLFWNPNPELNVLVGYKEVKEFIEDTLTVDEELGIKLGKVTLVS